MHAYFLSNVLSNPPSDIFLSSPRQPLRHHDICELGYSPKDDDARNAAQTTEVDNGVLSLDGRDDPPSKVDIPSDGPGLDSTVGEIV